MLPIESAARRIAPPGSTCCATHPRMLRDLAYIAARLACRTRNERSRTPRTMPAACPTQMRGPHLIANKSRWTRVETSCRRDKRVLSIDACNSPQRAMLYFPGLPHFLGKANATEFDQRKVYECQRGR